MIEEQALTQILESGLLGALLIVSFIVMFYLFKDTKAERNARLNDMKEVWQTDVKYREEIKNLIQSILDILRSSKK